jgi:hypothetical protein
MYRQLARRDFVATNLAADKAQQWSRLVEFQILTTEHLYLFTRSTWDAVAARGFANVKLARRREPGRHRTAWCARQ